MRIRAYPATRPDGTACALGEGSLPSIWGLRAHSDMSRRIGGVYRIRTHGSLGVLRAMARNKKRVDPIRIAEGFDAHEDRIPSMLGGPRVHPKWGSGPHGA